MLCSREGDRRIGTAARPLRLPKQTSRRQRPIAEPYPRGCSPLQGFLLHRLRATTEIGPASSALADEPATLHRPKPLLPFRPKVLPTVPLSGGASGDWHAMKAAGLSQDCRPSWGFAPRHDKRLFKRPPPWLMDSPRPRSRPKAGSRFLRTDGALYRSSTTDV